MRRAIGFILAGLLVHASGCAVRQSLGEPVDDAVRRATLLDARRRPDVTKAVFRTLIRWGGREISLTEVVKATPEGGLSVAGITDIGSTLYAAQIGADGSGRILSKSLPFSDRWLLDGPIAESLIPWYEPDEGYQLYRRPDETWALACKVRRITRLFLFDEKGNWRQFDRLAGSRLLSRTVLEWDDQPIPAVMRTENPARHYEVVRERVSTR